MDNPTMDNEIALTVVEHSSDVVRVLWVVLEGSKVAATGVEYGQATDVKSIVAGAIATAHLAAKRLGLEGLHSRVWWKPGRPDKQDPSGAE